jgi:hypothetical protein
MEQKKKQNVMKHIIDNLKQTTKKLMNQNKDLKC